MPDQSTSLGGVAAPRALPATYLGTYAGYPRSGCGPGDRALPGSFLGLAWSRIGQDDSLAMTTEKVV